MATNRPDATITTGDPTERLMSAVEASNVANYRAIEVNRQLKELKDELTFLEACILDEAYSTGALNGKNQEERERNRSVFLGHHPEYTAAKNEYDNAVRLCDEARIAQEATAREVGMWHAVIHYATAQAEFAAAQVSLQAAVVIHPPKPAKAPKAKAN